MQYGYILTISSQFIWIHLLKVEIKISPISVLIIGEREGGGILIPIFASILREEQGEGIGEC